MCNFEQEKLGGARLSGMSCVIDGTIPPSSGLSSSSALVCCAGLVTMEANQKSLSKVKCSSVQAYHFKTLCIFMHILKCATVQANYIADMWFASLQCKRSMWESVCYFNCSIDPFLSLFSKSSRRHWLRSVLKASATLAQREAAWTSPSLSWQRKELYVIWFYIGANRWCESISVICSS